ncbi:MAG: hypothetical protein WKF31_11280 [Thermoleophilaceae bacterium]
MLLSLLVGVADDLGGHLTSTEAEREGEGERQAADERGEADADDVGGDLELVQDREDRDPHDQHGYDGLHDLAGGGVPHRPSHEGADGGGDRPGDHEDEHRRHDVRQVADDRRRGTT